MELEALKTKSSSFKESFRSEIADLPGEKYVILEEELENSR